MATAKNALSEMFTGPPLVEGVEANLLRRRRLGGIGLIVGLIGAVLQVIMAVIDRGYFKALAELGKTCKEILAGQASPVMVIGLLGLLLLGVGLAIYLLVRWTRLLQKDSEEPFRYTVSMDPFKRIKVAAPDEAKSEKEGELALLHYDLRERLNTRIGRFSLLENRPAAPPGKASSPDAADRGARLSTSHVHITGEYVVRKECDETWVIHVMPTVQLGPASAPLTMAHPVRYDLGGTRPETLEPAHYEQIVERVYSSVATEIYRNIEADVRTKIDWFPTRHLRAVALFHEAQDMARSNTVDAYDRALSLYSSAQRFFDLALLRGVRRRLVKIPFIWSMNARYLQMRARVQIGYVRCQIYRQMTALQTGRKPNAIYECIWRMDKVIEDLRVVHRRLIACDAKRPDAKSQIRGYFTFQRDRFLRRMMRRPLERDFLRQRKILFDAYTVAAMAQGLLGNATRAREKLDAAVAVDPSLRERDPIHLVAEATISPDLRRRVKLLRAATDLSPTFQIAQYQLAQAVDLLFRDEGQLTRERVANVIQQYDEVLRINPGNISALASKGYLYWLTGQREPAEKCFRLGIDFKSIVSETSIAELTYGLARTLAEQGEFNEAFDQFMQAAAVDPDVAAWTLTPGESRAQGRYYNRINKAMAERFAEYAHNVELAFRFEPNKTLEHAVRSFAENDRANAYLNHYFRSGDPDILTDATSTLEKIAKTKPDNPIVHFNLAVAYEWGEKYSDALGSIDRAVKLAPEWQAARVLQITNTVSPYYIDQLKNQIQKEIEDLERQQKLAETEALRAQTSLAGDGGTKESGPAPAIEPRTTVGLSPKEEQLLRSRPSAKVEEATEGPPFSAGEPLTGTAKGPGVNLGQPLSADKATFLNRQRDMEQKLENIRQSYGPNLRHALRDLTRHSRLWHLLEPGSRDALPSEWADRALALDSMSGFRWEQLDGSDVLALKWLAYATGQSALKEHSDVMAGKDGRSEQAKKSLRTCARFHLSLAKRFLPEDVELCLGLSQNRGAQKKARSRRIDTVIGDTVAFWLEEDPWHYWALKFWISFLGSEKLLSLAESQLYSRFRDSRRLGLVVDQLLAEFDNPKSPFSIPVHELHGRGLEVTLQVAELCVAEAPSQQRFHYNLGRIHMLNKEWGKAVSAFNAAARARDVDPDLAASSLRGARAAAHENHGDELQRQERFQDAFNVYLALVQIDPSRGSAFSKLSQAWAALPKQSDRTKAAGSVREVVKNALAGNDLDEAERKNMKDLLERLRIGEFFGPRGLTRQHLVPPITIEVSHNLLDLVAKRDSELHPDLENEVGKLRKDLFLTMGVRIPALRFRTNQGDLSPGSYIISLDETPLVMGSLEPAGLFYSGSLDAATIERLHARAQADPLTDRPGWWMPVEETPNPGLERGALIGPRTFMMRHVESVLRGNLANFIGHSELNWMIDKLGLPAEQKTRLSTSRTALITALRSLLFERVPIAALVEILSAWPDIHSLHKHLRDQVEALRSLPELRLRLPGNDAVHSLFEIGPKFESALRENLHEPARVPVLALLPELCQDMLSAVRETLPSNLRATPAALVIKDTPLRPHLRELVKLEWPSLPVLAMAELGPEALTSPRTPLELK